MICRVWTLFLVAVCFALAGCQSTTKTYTHAQVSQPHQLTETKQSPKIEKIQIKEIELETSTPIATQSPQIHPALSTRHKVKKGETLWAISRYYSVSAQDIKDANDIRDARTLKIGQVLKIPLSKRKTALSLGNFAWPLEGSIVSHYKENILGKPNDGINIKPQDSCTVYASLKGKVEFAQDLKGYGYTIILKHPQGLNTIYSNLSSSFVRENEEVDTRQPIGKVGKDIRTQETFLHFEIRKEDTPVNPLQHLP